VLFENPGRRETSFAILRSVVIDLKTTRKEIYTNVKTLFAIVLTLGLLAASGFAQPAITQIQNAASNAVSPSPGTASGDCQCTLLPNAAIAQGSYFSLYGTGLGPSTAVGWNPYPLPTSLGGTSVSVTVGSTTVAAYPEFVNSTQINAVMPSTTPVGTGTITVTYSGQTSAAFPVTVAASSFGTFTVNEAGTGPGIVTNASYQILGPFLTAKPGDTVVLWGTGLGPAPNISTEGTAAPPQTNLCATAASCPITVWVGGLQATVAYAGRSGFTAEDQVDFVIPPGIQGCYVQVAVQTGTGTNAVVGNFTSMAVDPTGPTCQDVDGINYADIAATVASKGSANIGAISLLSNYLDLDLGILGTQLWDNDTVSGEIGTFSTGVLDLYQGVALAPSVSEPPGNNCTVIPFFAYPPPKDPGLAYITYLDAGASLSIQGPSGNSVSIPKNSNQKGYSQLVGGATIAQLLAGSGEDPFFLTSTNWPSTTANPYTYAVLPGTFTVTGPGGANVGALSAPITVSSAAASFQWTNQSSLTGSPIPRDQPLTITWTGGDPSGFIDITAISSTLSTGATPQTNTPGVLMECFVPASLQTFTIPTYVLGALPSTAGSQALVPPGELLVGPASSVVKVAPPTGLDELYIFYHYIEGANVTWQ
jgi:uncharacterized protein (TIGR03437 family)